MNLTHIKGSALHPVTPDGYIVHVCNDIGAWGGGFTKFLSEQWPQPEAEYREAFSRGKQLPMGEIQLVSIPRTGYTVVNMVAQRGVRSQSSAEIPLQYPKLLRCLLNLKEVLRESAEVMPVVHMPRIGCGLAGGNWPDVRSVIDSAWNDLQVQIYVYTLPHEIHLFCDVPTSTV